MSSASMLVNSVMYTYVNYRPAAAEVCCQHISIGQCSLIESIIYPVVKCWLVELSIHFLGGRRAAAKVCCQDISVGVQCTPIELIICRVVKYWSIGLLIPRVL